MIGLSFWLRGSFILAVSAVLSKGLSFWRDRLIVDFFEVGLRDVIFTSFRIPDFFYFLLISSTVSVIVLPRLQGLSHTQVQTFFRWLQSYLLVGIVVFVLGAWFLTPFLVEIVGAGLSMEQQLVAVDLVRWLFVSSGTLAYSALFVAWAQWRDQFWLLGLLPLVYMGGVSLGLYLGAEIYGVIAAGYGALVGSLVHLGLSLGLYLRTQPFALDFRTALPIAGIGRDAFLRLLNNSLFQINQTIDVIIAGFLAVGAVSAFAIGTSVGHFLVSIIGMSVATGIFSRLTRLQSEVDQMQHLLFRGCGLVFITALPLVFLALYFQDFIFEVGFGLIGSALWMTQSVFYYTVLSLPFACLIPVLSRYFLARGDVWTPLCINLISLTLATGVAAYLSLVYWSGEKAILGLAWGNLLANVGGALGFGLMIWWQSFKFYK